MSRLTPPVVPGLPLLGNALDFRRNPVELLQRGYETFGSIFSIRLGPKPAVVIIGPENQRFFFTETDRILSMSEVYKAFIPIFGKGFTLAVEPEEYKEQRAILQPVFSGRKMSDYLEVMRQETLAWLETLGDTGQFELCESFEKLSLNVFASLLMGSDFRQRMGSEFWSLYRDVVNGIDFLLPPFLPLPRFRRRDRARRTLHSKIRAMIAERRNHPNGHNDFLQTLAEAHYSNGQPVPEDTLESMILFLVFSASESTPLQTSWALIDLLRHPKYLDLVLAEQETILGNHVENISIETVERLETLEWAIKETERMRPMTTMLWRYTLQSYHLNNYYVPRGWITIISPAISHRLPEVFSNPNVYNPMRFSPKLAEDRKTPFSMACFGGGNHKCPGMSIAYTFMKVVFSLLLQRYTLTLVNPDPKPDYSTTITRPESPCPIRYQLREYASLANSGISLTTPQ